MLVREPDEAAVPLLLEKLRTGSLVTPERAGLVAGGLLLGYAVAVAILLLTAHGASDYHGRPLGTDFSNVYAAGREVLSGHATQSFDPAAHYHTEQSIFGSATPFYGWHYPPYFLLLAAPLATLPYLWALAAWLVGTLALYVAALRMLLRTGPAPELTSDRRWLVMALAFTATFVNLTHGNNGFLTAALLAFGLALIERRPLAAGLVLGCLVYKPQFVMLIPVALAFGGYWRTLAAGAVAVAALTLLTTLIFGVEVWRAFLVSTHFARSVVLEDGGTGFYKIQSVFAAIRLWGGSIALAYTFQAFATAGVTLGLALLWRAKPSFADKAAFLCLAVLLATPYSLDYDLVSLAPAIAVLAAQGHARGFRDYEATLLAILWLTPLISRTAAQYLFVPLGAIVMLAADGWLAARALARPVVLPQPQGSAAVAPRG